VALRNAGITACADHIFRRFSLLMIVKIAVSRKKYVISDEKRAFCHSGDHSFVKIALAGLGQNRYGKIRAWVHLPGAQTLVIG